MDVRNKDYHGYESRNRRDRMVNYWKYNIIPYHLPPISVKKCLEIEQLKKATSKIGGGRHINRYDLLGPYPIVVASAASSSPSKSIHAT